MQDSDLMTSFKDRIAIVTGGASGIGRGLCEELGRLDAVVIVADLDDHGAQLVASSITTAGGRASSAHLDVRRVEQVQKLVEVTVEEHQRLDYMFNNAGIGFWGEVRDMSLEQWHQLIDVNLWGVVYGSTTAYALMVKQGFGHIVNTASLAGLVPVPTATPYAVAKHGVVGFSISLREEAADLGVKVTVVCPGQVRTSFYNSLTLTDVHQNGPQLPLRAVDGKQAAQIILKGVTRNKRIIIFPLRARLTWMKFRFLPMLIARINRKMVRNLRASRPESG